MTALEKLVGAMTVGELARLAGQSVDDLVSAALGGTQRSVTERPAPKTARSGSVPRGALSPEAVLAALASIGGPATLEDIRKDVGGSANQLRSALKRLATSRKVRINGERRGTRYLAS